MWLVLKYNRKEFNFLKENLKKKVGDSLQIYKPKIKLQRLIKNKIKFLERDLLDDYLFCYHEKFKNKKMLMLLNNSRGLKYFLKNSTSDQTAIVNFIQFCKKNENDDGFLKQDFFDLSNFKRGIFISGPFTNLIFNIIENQGKRLKVLIGNVTTTIKKIQAFYIVRFRLD